MIGLTNITHDKVIQYTCSTYSGFKEIDKGTKKCIIMVVCNPEQPIDLVIEEI